MTLERLEQYAAKRRELETLRQRVKDEQYRANERVFDTVRGSMPEFPYTSHVVTIKGVMARRSSRLARLAIDYEQRADEDAAELAEIEAWVKTIPDSTVRNIVELRFIAGQSWNATARKVYGKPCGDAARMKIKRFFEGNS